MAEVITPFGRHSISQPDEDVITSLEKALEQARRGEIVGIGMTLVGPNGWTESRYTGSVGSHALVSGAAWLQRDIMDAQKEKS